MYGVKTALILLAIAGAANSCLAKPGNSAEKVVTVHRETRQTCLPGTAEHAAATAWLNDRKAEGQVPKLARVSPDDSGTVTIVRSTIRSNPEGASAKSAADSSAIPESHADVLSKEGKAGDTVSYTSCQAGGSKMVYSFKWDSLPDGGKRSWVLANATYTASSDSCG